VKDDGAVSALMLSLLALAALLCLATADAANVLVTRARAQTAADAAALAAAAAQWRGEDPAAVARSVTQRNGAELDRCECEPHGDSAVVDVGAPTRVRMLGIAPRRVTARATARLEIARLFEPAS
jgi:secretion/DNA translocation related TadE-like protein